MLYIIKRLSDSYYLTSFEDKKQIVFSPIKTDALMLPQNIAERYVKKIEENINDKCEVIPAK